MPNKRKRKSNPNYKARYASYRASEKREKNKAKRVIKNLMRSMDVNKAFGKMKDNMNPIVAKYVEKTLHKV